MIEFSLLLTRIDPLLVVALYTSSVIAAYTLLKYTIIESASITVLSTSSSGKFETMTLGMKFPILLLSLVGGATGLIVAIGIALLINLED